MNFKNKEIKRIYLHTIKHNIKSFLRFPKKKFNGFVDAKSNLNDHFLSTEFKLSNDFYGIASSLKKYAGYKKKLRVFIEHGLYFGSHVDDVEISGIFPALITFGDMRRNVIEKKSDNVIPICIGPYIKYASPYYSEKEQEKILKKYGKILLFFPQHTIDGIKESVNSDKLINNIMFLQKKYKCDSVFVSVYYREIKSDIVKKYSDSGFIVVSAGNRQDPNFLSRLRSFIDLSYITASNNVGTHIGYCLSLNKRHYMLTDDSKLFAVDSDSVKNVPELYLEDAVEQKRDIKRILENGDNHKHILDYYWGNNNYYSPDELKYIFDFFEKVYNYSIKNKISNKKSFKILVSSDKKMEDILRKGC